MPEEKQVPPLNLNQEEFSLILDGLSALPLSRSYNLFNKLLKASGLQRPAGPQDSTPPATENKDGNA